MKKSERKKWIEKCQKIIREHKIRTFGNKCQFCGKKGNLGLFHILSVGAYPRLALCEDNMLLACWFPCHNGWHHNYYFARDVIAPKIRQICGDDYESYLKKINEEMPKLSLLRIKEIFNELQAKKN